MAVQEIYTFGGFTLDVAERRLSRDGEALTLAPKAFDLLVALVRRPGRLVGKTELLETIWPESFVEEGILTVHVSALRKALNDTSRTPVFIETVARSGYRFIAPVVEEATDRRVIPGRWSIAGAACAITDRRIGRRSSDRPGDQRRPDRSARPVRSRRRTADRGSAAPARAPEDPAAAGRMLRSDAVLDSCFERTSEGVRLSARLIHADDGEPLWHGEFDDSSGGAAAGAVADALRHGSARTLHDPLGQSSWCG